MGHSDDRRFFDFNKNNPYICNMKVYNNPRKIKWEKHRDEEIKDKVKKNSPKPTKHITSEGEKIIYIPYDSDYHKELENEHKERKVNTKNTKKKKKTPKKSKKKENISSKWVDRKYILKNFPIGESTYDNRVAILDTEKYKEFTFRGGKFGKRFIDKSIIDEVFLPDRLPNQNEPDKIVKWVKKQEWSYIGNVTPDSCDINANVYIVRSILKIIQRENKDAVLFYTVGKNESSGRYYFTHFLIKSDKEIDVEKVINGVKKNKILKQYIFPKEFKKNKRIMIDLYDEELYGFKGVSNVLKYNDKIGIINK